MLMEKEADRFTYLQVRQPVLTFGALALDLRTGFLGLYDIE